MSLFASLFSISLAAVLAENFILVKFLGICPFMGVSKKMDTALGMGLAVIFVMGLASAATWAVNTLLLVPLALEYMQTVVFILVIATLVQLVEIYGVMGGVGFTVAILLFSSVRERLEDCDCPEAFKGFPIALIAAGLLALAFMGFSGLKIV